MAGVKMSKIRYAVDVTPPTSADAQYIETWSKAAIVFSVGLTAVWMCFLGYELIKLIGITFW